MLKTLAIFFSEELKGSLGWLAIVIEDFSIIVHFVAFVFFLVAVIHNFTFVDLSTNHDLLIGHKF